MHSQRKQILNSKFNQVIPTEDTTISSEPGLLTVNSIVNTSKKISSLCCLLTIIIIFQLRKGSTISKIETCDFVNVKDLKQLEQQTSLKVRSLDNLTLKITVPINHRETVEDLIEENVDLFPKKDTD